MLPAWPCEPTFGELCSPRGLDVLSVVDKELAYKTGLRVFVYKDLPRRFHRGLFDAGKPKEVREGRVCDFIRSPCTPPDPEQIPRSVGARQSRATSKKSQYSIQLNEWITGAKHCADVPLLSKLLALGSLPGVHTPEPSQAHLFVVPFLGGFIERVSPAMTNDLIKRQASGHGVMDDLFNALPHLNRTTAARHLFLLTNSCGGCLRRSCSHCSPWHRVKQDRGVSVQLAATLGPTWPHLAPKHAPLRQVIIPPNIMEVEFHGDNYVPLCPEGMGARTRRDARGRRCRPNTAKKELLLFYQGAHSFNGFRAQLIGELDRFFNRDGAIERPKCDCSIDYRCCVNATARIAYFFSGSHWHPTPPLGFRATIEWMQRARFCLCPPGDVPYNKRYFTALLAGCVPVLFSFPSQIRGEKNWWKPNKGPGQRDIDPFYSRINHSELVVEIPIMPGASTRGVFDRLHGIPDVVIEAKQRAIERVRHLLLYNMDGTRPDAFTLTLLQLLEFNRPLLHSTAMWKDHGYLYAPPQSR